MGVREMPHSNEKLGYVQQQDLHLETSTVREALQFSALLRQPASTTKQEKLAYLEEVIKLLDMETYAGAIVGVPGEGNAYYYYRQHRLRWLILLGLNVEQRKRLTIGVELAAKPELLLFLDEPTSGLDSQTSWAILDLLQKLTAHGQAILCTIPSVISHALPTFWPSPLSCCWRQTGLFRRDRPILLHPNHLL